MLPGHCRFSAQFHSWTVIISTSSSPPRINRPLPVRGFAFLECIWVATNISLAILLGACLGGRTILEFNHRVAGRGGAFGLGGSWNRISAVTSRTWPVRRICRENHHAALHSVTRPGELTAKSGTIQSIGSARSTGDQRCHTSVSDYGVEISDSSKSCGSTQGTARLKKKDSPTALAGGADPGTFTAPCAVGWVRNLA